jgi:PIN domain nuclease of toxin-antitoxin system
MVARSRCNVQGLGPAKIESNLEENAADPRVDIRQILSVGKISIEVMPIALPAAAMRGADLTNGFELATQLPADYSRDPCDRLTGATALAEGISLTTKDAKIRRSKQVKIIW